MRCSWFLAPNASGLSAPFSAIVWLRICWACWTWAFICCIGWMRSSNRRVRSCSSSFSANSRSLTRASLPPRRNACALVASWAGSGGAGWLRSFLLRLCGSPSFLAQRLSAPSFSFANASTGITLSDASSGTSILASSLSQAPSSSCRSI